MVASITRIESPLNFLRNMVKICYSRSQITDLCHIFKTSLSYLYIMIFPCILQITGGNGRGDRTNTSYLGVLGFEFVRNPAFVTEVSRGFSQSPCKFRAPLSKRRGSSSN
jgi:hypothetical protein